VTTSTAAGSGAPCGIAGCDHGTHVAGIAAGRDATRRGVAPQARIIAIQGFSQFTDMLDLIADQLQCLHMPFLMLSGKTVPDQRGAVVKQFQAGQVPVFLISLKAGGVGLNLTAADTVIHMDPWWNPAVQAQATARAHRLGQDQPVFVYQLVVEGSIEERMLELQARKQALTEGVLGFDTDAAVKFNQADLDALLAPLA
jgi:SNF2 family DNA or RNA helicase